jgi:carbamoyltransferase
MKGSFLGPEFSDEEIETELNISGAVYKKLPDNDLIEVIASSLSKEKAVGLMNGRMEFGPRALGCRSIIADPRSPLMQKQLNLKVKYRESFRPFAPSILIEDVNEWFELNTESPYMLLVANVQKDKRLAMTSQEEALFGIDKLNIPRSSVPAITHVDFSARVQTVHKDTNSRYHSIISRFKEKTGCPLVVNTSFNVRGEPIVCTPTDAFRCFMGTQLDILAIGNYLLIKEEQNSDLELNYKDRYELD